MFVCLSACLSVCPSVRPSVCPSVCLSVCLTIVYLSVCPSICYLSVCMFACLLVWQSACLCVRVCLHTGGYVLMQSVVFAHIYTYICRYVNTLSKPTSKASSPKPLGPSSQQQIFRNCRGFVQAPSRQTTVTSRTPRPARSRPTWRSNLIRVSGSSLAVFIFTTLPSNIGALIITYTTLGVPHDNYGIIYPKTLF